MNNENLTAEDYSTWLVVTMSALDEGSEFEMMQQQFNTLWEQIAHLYLCYEAPSYEPKTGD